MHLSISNQFPIHLGRGSRDIVMYAYEFVEVPAHVSHTQWATLNSWGKMCFTICHSSARDVPY